MSHFYPLNCIDFYKSGHRQQYPWGTELVVSNFTPRSGKHSNVEDSSGIIFFGLQYFIKDFLIETWKKGFFDLPKENVVKWYKQRMDTSLGVDSIPVDHVEALHDLGYLPIEIRAVAEGTFVPVGIPCMTIQNTLPDFFWLTNYLETILSAYMWLPCTSATTALGYKKLFLEFANKTGAPVVFCDFQGHDFSFRGMSSLQSAVVSGAGHLLSFVGTDTVPAIDFLERYYGADCTKELIGCSVPATEHSVMCMGGEDDEIGTFRRLITEIYPRGIVSIVSDTWDFWQVLTNYAVTLTPEIMAREGKVVFRPDSGDPVKIICGDPEADFGSAEYKGAVEILWEIFGGDLVSGSDGLPYRVLDSHIGLIYGDSITYKIAKEILQILKNKGFASSSVVFGIGSYTYQMATRDTWGWAVKATYGVVNGKPRNIFKKPKTDNGEKNSAKGLLIVRSVDGKLVLEQEATPEEFDSEANLLRPVFKNGSLLKEQTLQEIRGKVNGNF